MTLEEAILEQHIKALESGQWRGGSNHEDNNILWIGRDEQAEIMGVYVRPFLPEYNKFISLIDKWMSDGDEDDIFMEAFEARAVKAYELAEARVVEMIVQSLSDINKSYIHSSKGVKVTHIMDVELKPVGE